METVITAFAAISNALNHSAPKARHQRKSHVNKGRRKEVPQLFSASLGYAKIIVATRIDDRSKINPYGSPSKSS